MTVAEPLLSVKGLTIVLGDSGDSIIEDIDLDLGRGAILGIAGESGSGKSTLALALLGFARPGARISRGSITVDGESVLDRSPSEMRNIRGQLVSYVPQNPASSLNPARRIGAQLEDRLQTHAPETRAAKIERAMTRAQLPSGSSFLRRFPHQLSGGQQQRVMIAMAIVSEPRLIVLDEPTTGLDVVTQAGLISEICSLRDELRASMVYVSHDIAAVASLADDAVVMYAGRIVERGSAELVLGRPLHPYTHGLIRSVPDPRERLRLEGLTGVTIAVGEWPAGCAFEARCTQRVDACRAMPPALVEAKEDHFVRCIEWARTPVLRRTTDVAPRRAATEEFLLRVKDLDAEHRSKGSVVVAAQGISFDLARGECLALVGESGSGKTTIARCVAGLHPPSHGTISLDGVALQALAGDRDREARRRIQIIFQNQYESLNPRHKVGSAVAWAATSLRGLSKGDARTVAGDALDRVRLPKRVLDRYPGELSGGERQRVAIARALVVDPDVLICDEITSALDVSVQGAVLDLLADLRASLGLSLLFITHDLGVVASAADRVMVLSGGRICESGHVDEVLRHPSDSYTRTLVSAAPLLDVPTDVGHTREPAGSGEP